MYYIAESRPVLNADGTVNLYGYRCIARFATWFDVVEAWQDYSGQHHLHRHLARLVQCDDDPSGRYSARCISWDDMNAAINPGTSGDGADIFNALPWVELQYPI